MNRPPTRFALFCLIVAACSSPDDDDDGTTSPGLTTAPTTTELATSSDGSSESSDLESSSTTDADAESSSDDDGSSSGSSTTTGSVSCELTFPTWDPCTPGCGCDEAETACLIGHTAEFGHLAYCAPVCESDADCGPDPEGRASFCAASANLQRCAIACTDATEATDCPPAWHCYSSDLAEPQRCMPEVP